MKDMKARVPIHFETRAFLPHIKIEKYSNYSYTINL